MRVLLRNAGLGFVGGVLLWGTGDVLGELTTYFKLRNKALELASENEDLKAQIGHPFNPGPWYDAKIGFMGAVAQCTFQLQGNKQVTDVTVKGMRAKGFHNRALYNILGPGAWVVIDCTAMFPDSEGFVQPRSLLPPTSKAQQQPQGEACESCNATSCSQGGGHAPAYAGEHTCASQKELGTGESVVSQGKRSTWFKSLRWFRGSGRGGETEHNSGQ